MEDFRVRTLKSINVLNLLLTFHMGHIGKLIESMDKKLLVMKIIERSQSLRNKIIVWINQIARGIRGMLKYAHNGVKECKKLKKKKNTNN